MTEKHAWLQLLGGFRVLVDGQERPAEGWPTRRSAELVQLLALAERHQLAREQVMEALWPRLAPRPAAANLRKAAHYARRAIGDDGAVVLRGGQVLLLPGWSVDTDVRLFLDRAREALRRRHPEGCAAAVRLYGGELLPDSRYAEWALAHRDHLRSVHQELLRASGQWQRLVEADPTDEDAHRRLMVEALREGNRHLAIRWYGRLRTALAAELGMSPAPETEALYEECIAGLRLETPALIGRQPELAEAGTVLETAGSGETLVLAVRGAPGIGKTLFSRHVATGAREQGWIVLEAGCDRETSSYGPLSAVLTQLVGRRPSLLDALGDRSRRVVAHLLALPDPPHDVGFTRQAVIGATRRLLASAGGPLAVVVDDAHHADDATVDVLVHLARQGGLPLLILLAYRPESAPTSLARRISGLARNGRAREVDLAPLCREEAAALVVASAPGLDREAVDRIVETAEGNPFFILELSRGAAAGDGHPAAAWEALTWRFVDLPEATIAMLARLAVAGAEVDLDRVLALTGLPEAESFALLDEACSSGVLVVADDAYRFRHELVRQALVERVPPHRRVAVHRDAARRLACSGASPGLVAEHWLQGGRPEEAIPWLLAAARQAAALGAFGDVLGYVERLLHHAPGHPEGLLLRADSLEALGESGALEAYTTAVQAASEDEAHEILPRKALAQLKHGDATGALRTLRAARPVTLEGRLHAAITLSGAAVVGAGDPEEAARAAEEVRRLALDAGDLEAVTHAAWAQSLAAHARGDLTTRLLDDLMATRRTPDLAVRVFDGYLCAAERLLYGARPYGEVVGFAESLADEARRQGARRALGFALTLKGEAELLAGRVVEADGDLAAAVELQGAIGAAAGEAMALQRRAEAALCRGATADAGALLDDALAAARESGLGHHLLDRIYGTRLAVADDADSALALLQDGEEATRGPDETCPPCRITFAVPAAIASAKAGDIARAARYAELAEWLAAEFWHQRGWDAAVSEVMGHLSLAQGDRSAAARHFSRAAGEFALAGQPLDEARCRAAAESI